MKQPLAEAVERAIDECIAEDVLKDFLTKHRAEAKAMSIFEYDQEKHIRQEREEAWEEGQASGLKLAETIFRLFREGKTTEEIGASSISATPGASGSWPPNTKVSLKIGLTDKSKNSPRSL